jgi:hypothetical protein
MKQDPLALDQFLVRKIPAILLTGILWLISASLALMSIFAIREVLIWGLGAILAPSDTASRNHAADIINLTHHCTVIFLGLVSMVVVVASSEIAIRKPGQPRTLRILALISLVEGVIVVPVALLFWR